MVTGPFPPYIVYFFFLIIPDIFNHVPWKGMARFYYICFVASISANVPGVSVIKKCHKNAIFSIQPRFLFSYLLCTYNLHITLPKNLRSSRKNSGSGKSSTPRKVLPREKVYPGKSLPWKKSTILIQSSWYWRNLKHSWDEYFHQVS